jgi:PAS domain S-box-containing protein
VEQQHLVNVPEIAPFSLAIEAAPTGMLMVDNEGRIVMLNAHIERLFGYVRAELIGQPIELLVPERLRGSHPQARRNFFNRPETRPMGAGRDLYGLRKDGSEVPLEIGLNPLRLGDREFILSSVVDITERKRAVEQFRQAIEAAPTGMLMVDSSGRIVLVNAQVERLFGYVRAELIGQAVEMLVPERFRAAHPGSRLSFFGSLQARPMGAGRDLYGRRKDGSEIRIEIGLNPLRTAEGDFVLSSVADVTERTRAQREREDLLERLQALNIELTRSLQEREVLLKEVHHRVKNNLQIVSSLMNMQIRKLDGARGVAALEECQMQVQTMALIHEKLYHSADYARVPLADYVRSVASMVFETMDVRTLDVGLVFETDAVELAVDKAIPCGLVVNELMTNAIKHAFPAGRPGKIALEIERLPGSRVRLRVADDGIGLSAPVDQLGKTSLGLQLVQALARQLQAELSVSGHGGTSFQLVFQEDA